MLRCATTLLCAIVLAAGCASPVVTSAPQPTNADPSLGSTAPAETATAGSAATSTPDFGVESPATPAPPDLSARPLIWFTPHPETRLPDFMKGSADYFELFADGSPWSTAADRVHVFKAYDNLGVARESTDDEIRTVLSGLRDRSLAFALELGPLPHPLGGGSNTECGDGVEGFAAPFTLDIVERITGLGGRVDFVAFDEPFAHATLYDGPNACGWSSERVATEIVEFVRALRELQPDVIVGDIEPAWNGPLVGAAEIGSWLDAYAAAAGEPLGFFHLDVDWTRDDWQTVAREIEDAVRARGVPFGIIYNGGEDAASDAEWLQLSAERAYGFEQLHGGDPDQVVFQSWHFYPTRVLPDSDPAAFTGLINRYFGERTAMSSVSGDVVSLQTAAGAPVAGASLEATAQPLDGAPEVLSLSGVVPDGVQTGVVVLRVNSEEAGPGPADINIYEIAYSENGGGNSLANPRFRRGLDGWVPFGDGEASVVGSDRDDGRMLRVRAEPDQLLHVDAFEFAVASGAAFELRVMASIPAESAASAYVAVIFLAGTEVERHRLDLAPTQITLGSVVTDAAGMGRVDLSGLAGGRYRLRVKYSGDMTHWPSWLDHEVNP